MTIPDARKRRGGYVAGLQHAADALLDLYAAYQDTDPFKATLQRHVCDLMGRLDHAMYLAEYATWTRRGVPPSKEDR